MSNLVTRAITGALFVGVILGSLFLSKELSLAVFSIFMILGLFEFYNLFKNHKSVSVSLPIGITASLLLYGLLSTSFFNVPPDVTKLVVPLILPILFITALLELWRNKKRPMINSAVMFFGFIYVVLPFFFLMKIHWVDNGTFPLIAGMLILVWSNDTFAYLSGRTFGKTKLFERISPNKTWEGTIGGILMTSVIGLTIGYFQENYLFWGITAIIVGVSSILGDLTESMYKRSLNIKDSGSILPGHGGILDRFDATLFSIPFFFLWIQLYVILIN